MNQGLAERVPVGTLSEYERAARSPEIAEAGRFVADIRRAVETRIVGQSALARPWLYRAKVSTNSSSASAARRSVSEACSQRAERRSAVP